MKKSSYHLIQPLSTIAFCEQCNGVPGLSEDPRVVHGLLLQYLTQECAMETNVQELVTRL